MSATKKGFSACEIKHQTGYKRSSVWSIIHHLREAMGERDECYQLEGMVEFDVGYFPIETSKKDRVNLNLGRGSQRCQNVMVMAESTFMEDIETGKISKHCRFFKMKVIQTLESEEIDDLVKN